MAKPVLPEGHVVEYQYGETSITHDGRELVFPHRYTRATVWQVTELDEKVTEKKLVAVATAICREGPATDEDASVFFQKMSGFHFRPGSHGYDQFSKEIGRNIALGRALKKLKVAA